MKINNWYTAAVFICAFLSVSFFTVLFFSIRCEPDDMITALKFRNQSFSQIISNDYYYNLFRPAALISFFGVGYSANTDLYPYSILNLFLFITSVFVFSTYKLIVVLFNLHLTTAKEKITLASGSMLLFTSLYFLTTNRIEIFGWMSAFITHFMPVAFIVFSAWVIIKKTNSTFDFLWLTISAFLIGGSAEHITPSVLLAIAPILFLLKFKNKKLLYFTVVLICIYIVSVITPGTLYRINTTNEYINSHPSSQTVNPFYFIKMFFQPYKIIGTILLFVCWMTFIKTINPQNSPIIRWRYFFIPIITSLIIAIAVAGFVYKSFSETRLLFMVDFALFVFINALAFKFVPKLQNISFLFPSLTVVSIAVLLFFNFRHIPRLRYFANKHGETINYLKQQSSNQVITIPAFPAPDLTNQALLYSDPENQDNQLFCRFYNIKAKVSVKN
ncbi:MAG TPA: hypothetical protein VN698_09185 [Bacteroidia bacterium]|nr:hypothetical protein [Bacteroidia bacterium]